MDVGDVLCRGNSRFISSPFDTPKGPDGVIFYEPWRLNLPTKGAGTFVDGQKVLYAAKAGFGYTHPNYDPKALAAHFCQVAP